MYTRAVHLEFLVAPISEEAALLFIQRMAAPMSMPLMMYSDNASGFKAARRHLKELYEVLNGEALKKKLNVAPYNIEWRHTPPVSSYKGGIFERVVRTVKAPFYKVFKSARLN